MGRSSREQNLGLRIGDTIIHCNDEFVVVDIKREEKSDGMQIVIYAVDPDQASKVQEEQIKSDQMMTGIMDIARKVMDKGIGGLGDIGK